MAFKTYIARDGSWGDAEGLVVADTTDWTPWMFLALDDESDSKKAELAQHFMIGVHPWKDAMCVTCGLEARALNVSE
jgi:hypothetical protein